MATTAVITGAEFDALPYEEGRKWELIEGELVPVPSPTPRHQEIVIRILLALRRYFADGGCGTAYQDVEFALGESVRLRPDVAVLLGEKARQLDLDTVPVPVAPDLAVEVISPSERASDSYDMVRTYLRRGVTEVWQIYPKSQSAQIYHQSGSDLLEGDQLLTSELLPGFQLSLASLFQ